MQTVASPVPVAVVRYTNSGNNLVVSAASQFIACDGKTAAIQAYYDSNGNKSPNNQPFPVPASPVYVDYFFNMVPQPGENQGRDIVIAALNDQARTMVGFDLAQTTPLFNMPNTGPEIVGLSVLSPDGSKMAEIQMQNPQIQLWDISKIQALKEKYQKPQDVLPQFNIEGDDITHAAAIEQAFGITVADARVPAQSSIFKCSVL